MSDEIKTIEAGGIRLGQRLLVYTGEDHEWLPVEEIIIYEDPVSSLVELRVDLPQGGEWRGEYKPDKILRYKDPLPPVQRFTVDNPAAWFADIGGLYWRITCPQCGDEVEWGKRWTPRKGPVCNCGIQWRVEVEAVGERRADG